MIPVGQGSRLFKFASRCRPTGWQLVSSEDQMRTTRGRETEREEEKREGGRRKRGKA